jgi:hypothetical protein
MFIPDPDIAMPLTIQHRNYILNKAALCCYDLRDLALSPELAELEQKDGDELLGWAMASLIRGAGRRRIRARSTRASHSESMRGARLGGSAPRARGGVRLGGWPSCSC